jgi:DNA-nicking Smr family endonuclease
MAKKRKQNQQKVKSPVLAEPSFSSPFKDLKKMVAERARAKAVAAPEPAPKRPTAPSASEVSGKRLDGKATASPKATSEPDLDDEAILRQALEGVRPFNGRQRERIPVEPTISRAVVSEDDEVIAMLSDLVSGQAPFDITETDEYVEGSRVGLDPRLLSQLRRGEFAVQAHLDLHGMIQSAAKEALKEFIIGSVRKGLRTVLVVHGRGFGSPGGRPILKHACAGWLSHGAIGGHVLAFTSARPSDGGAGAMYVLLRREKRRAPFDILLGAKRG